MENPTIGLAIIAGLLSFISPCVLPLVPAYIGYMGGRMTHTVASQTNVNSSSQTSIFARLFMLIHAFAFVSGFTFVFVSLGILGTAFIGQVGQQITTITDIIGRLGGVILIFFGIHIMGFMPRLFRWLRKKDNVKLIDNVLLSIIFTFVGAGLIYWGFVEEIIIVLPLVAAFVLALFLNGAYTEPAIFWNRLLDRIELMLYSDTRRDIQPNSKGGLAGSFFMGMVFSAGWTPCIGPLYGAILNMALVAQTDSNQILEAAKLLAAYSLGLGLPFILTALLLNQAQRILRRLQGHMHKIEVFTGGLLVVLGILIASNQLQSLSQTFSQGEFSDFAINVEECGIGFVQGEIELSHVGSCLNGSLIPVVMNQSASGEIDSQEDELQYLFHASTEEPIDIEIRGVKEDIFNFKLVLISPDSQVLLEVSKADSIRIDDKLYPLVNYTPEMDGIYRAIISSLDPIENARFRIKIRDTEELATNAGQSFVDVVASGTIGGTPTAIDGSGQGDSLNNIAGNALNSLSGLANENNTNAEVGLALGDIAPDFSIQLDTGETVQLSSLRGNIVLLNFWGTWCGPCRREMPEFQRIYTERKDDNFTILAIAFDDTLEAIAKFREEFELSFPLALDESGAINTMYAIQTRPSTYLIDANGIIVARHYGMLTEEQIQEMLAEITSTTKE